MRQEADTACAGTSHRTPVILAAERHRPASASHRPAIASHSQPRIPETPVHHVDELGFLLVRPKGFEPLTF